MIYNHEVIQKWENDQMTDEDKMQFDRELKQIMDAAEEQRYDEKLQRIKSKLV